MFLLGGVPGVLLIVEFLTIYYSQKMFTFECLRKSGDSNNKTREMSLVIETNKRHAFLLV